MTSVGSMDDDVREILARTAAAADLSLRSSASPASSLDSAFAQPLRELQLQEQDRAVTETVERMRRVLASSFDRQLRLGDHPARVADSPPPWAKTFYKVRPPTPLHQLPRPAGRTGSRLRQVLAFVDGQYLSVFDGRTVYSPGQTARPVRPCPPGTERSNAPLSSTPLPFSPRLLARSCASWHRPATRAASTSSGRLRTACAATRTCFRPPASLWRRRASSPAAPVGTTAVTWSRSDTATRHAALPHRRTAAAPRAGAAAKTPRAAGGVLVCEG